jgi:hypothetical protein
MGGPFGFSWGTFAALLVVAGTVLLAIVWAIVTARRDRDGGGGDE